LDNQRASIFLFSIATLLALGPTTLVIQWLTDSAFRLAEMINQVKMTSQLNPVPRLRKDVTSPPLFTYLHSMHRNNFYLHNMWVDHQKSSVNRAKFKHSN